jgi:hypothetical protein
MDVRRISGMLAAALGAVLSASCSSIGPGTVPRDRSDYASALGASWKQQTLLNIIKLRYGDFPIFMEVSQVIAGYQFQATAAAGFSAQNYLSSSVGGPAAIAGTAGVGATYIDRPTVIYAPLTGNDFIKTLMRPIPPSAVLFLLQAGYPATIVLPLAVDSVNGVANESRHATMNRAGDPEFFRLAQLLYELQRANALQVRIERSKDNSEVSIVGFPPANVPPEIAARIGEARRILHLAGGGQSHQVRYGGWSGRGDEIAITTRSMLQVMVELGVLAQVPEADIAGGRATPGVGAAQAAGGERQPLLAILSGAAPPSDAYAAVQYKGHWFWIADTDIRSKSLFSSVMLLFSISDVGVRTAAPVVTVPAQ